MDRVLGRAVVDISNDALGALWDDDGGPRGYSVVANHGGVPQVRVDGLVELLDLHLVVPDFSSQREVLGSHVVELGEGCSHLGFGCAPVDGEI